MGTQLPPSKGGEAPSPIFGPFVLWPNGWMHQDAIWYKCTPQPRGHCVRWRTSPPPRQGGKAPQFSAHVYCGQTAGCIKMPLGMHVGLSPGDCVRWRTSPPPRQGGGAPQFSAHVYFGQTAAWIKMPLCMEVGLGLRDIVFDVDPATPRKRAHQLPPNFWPMSIVAKWLNG